MGEGNRLIDRGQEKSRAGQGQMGRWRDKGRVAGEDGVEGKGQVKGKGKNEGKGKGSAHLQAREERVDVPGCEGRQG